MTAPEHKTTYPRTYPRGYPPELLDARALIFGRLVIEVEEQLGIPHDPETVKRVAELEAKAS